MPNILCPKCNSTLAIADESVGYMVQCGSCHNVFNAVVEPPSNRSRVDDGDDEPPSKRKRSRRDDEDDEDERPGKRRKRKRYRDDDREEPIIQAGNGMATASLVLGIIALVIELPSFVGTIFGAVCCAFCGVLFWPGHGLAILLAIIGLVLGLMGMKNPAGKGASMAGSILSGVSLFLAIAAFLLNIMGFAVQAAKLPLAPPAQNWNQPQPNPPRPNFPK